MMSTSADHGDTTLLAFLHRFGKSHEIRTVNGVAVSIAGFYHCKATGVRVSSFKAVGAPKNDPAYEYSIAFTPNGDGASWTMDIRGEDDKKNDFLVTTLEDVVNAVSVFID